MHRGLGLGHTKVIAIDCDEVLQPFQAAFLLHHNATYGTEFVYPDLAGRYYLEDFTGDSHVVVEEKLHRFVGSPAFDSLAPLPGAVQAIKVLREKGFELNIVTARQGFYMEATHRFVERHFANAFAGVHFIEDFVGSSRHPAAAKLKICQGLGVSYLVDDNLATVKMFHEAGIQGILFGEYGWNAASELPEGLVRCADWPAVREYFDGK